MAFNWRTFKTRTLTAAVFVIVMLAGLLVNHWTFFILFTIIHLGCWMEYQRLVGLIDPEYKNISTFHKYGVMLAGWAIMLNFTNEAFTIDGFRLKELSWWFGLIFVVTLLVELPIKKNQPKLIAHSLLGLLYISLRLGLFIVLYNGIDIHVQDTTYVITDNLIVMTIIASIWINDTMAYFVGSVIGKTPLSKISPKKTWEGTIAGVILSVGVIGLISFYGLDLTWFAFHMIIIAAITAIAGTFGDLFESKLKRLSGVKDSGHIMPGHGGFLDRFDSLLFAAPAVWLYVYFVMS
jgi:phosphatidate cytidylyltransferase